MTVFTYINIFVKINCHIPVIFHLGTMRYLQGSGFDKVLLRGDLEHDLKKKIITTEDSIHLFLYLY